MAEKQWFIPGFGQIHEDSDDEWFVPGYGQINEDQVEDKSISDYRFRQRFFG